MSNINDSTPTSFEDLDLSFLYDLESQPTQQLSWNDFSNLFEVDLSLDLKNRKDLHVPVNRNSYKNKVKVGQILTIEDMVEIFGTKANKLAFQKNKKLPKNSKDALINKVRQYCSISEINKDKHKKAGTKTQYEVKKIYDFKLNSKLIKYLNTDDRDTTEEINIPREKRLLFKNTLLKVVVNAILTNKNENNCLSFRLMEYARTFSLINNNYQYLKYTVGEKRQQMIDALNVTELAVQDFYTSVDNSVNNAILDALDVLAAVRAIVFTKNMLILIKKREDGTYYKVRATEDEEGIVTQATNKFVADNKIKDNSVLFYNKKVKARFFRYIAPILESFDAVSYYRTYEVFITNTPLLQYILEVTEFDKKDLPVYNVTLNTLFLERMYLNATKKKENRLVKYICESDIIFSYLIRQPIPIKDINIKNFRDIIPPNLIDIAVEGFKEYTKKKIEKHDFNRLSDSYVDLDHFDILCQTNIKLNPSINLFCIDIDNSVENKQYNNTASVLN